MALTANKSVGEIAVETPQAIPYFEKKGIDYCCGGQRSLQEACAKAGVSFEDTLTALHELTVKLDDKEPSNPWPTINSLIQYLLDKHHAFTREQLNLCAKLGSKVLMVHGNHHPELKDITGVFNEMAEELQQHLLKEEHVAFPFLRSLEGKNEALPFPYEIFKSAPQRVLMGDHEMVGEQLTHLRRLTNDYTPPADACVTFRAYFQGLRELEEDLHRHIHLENNVLFPMAEKLASSL